MAIEAENDIAVLRGALMLACMRVADGPQEYHEANTPQGWAEVYIDAIRQQKTPAQIIEERPAPRLMTDGERAKLFATL